MVAPSSLRGILASAPERREYSRRFGEETSATKNHPRRGHDVIITSEQNVSPPRRRVGRVIVAFVSLPEARAETAAPATNVTATPKPPACSDSPSDTLPPGNLKLTVVVDPTTLWQPRGGEVKFTIKGTGFFPDNMAIIACFRWKADATAEWYRSPSLRLIDSETVAGAFGFAATVPPNFPPAQFWWLQRIFGWADRGASTGLDLVPVADFRVMAKSLATTSATTASAWSPLDVTLPVGITSPTFSFILTIVLIVIAWTALYHFGKIRGVPGEDVILKIISTKGGYASLSQLQIILWSFVIGGGARST
jgi:hypothetical protein